MTSDQRSVFDNQGREFVSHAPVQHGTEPHDEQLDRGYRQICRNGHPPQKMIPLGADSVCPVCQSSSAEAATTQP